MSTLGHTLAGIDYHNHREQLKDTWGHLAPKKNKTYRGRVVYAIGCFGDDKLNPTVIDYDFGDLASSPWFYEALHEFLGDGDAPNGYDGHSYMIGGLRNDEGCVYEWTGTMRNYNFTGQRRLVFSAAK